MYNKSVPLTGRDERRTGSMQSKMLRAEIAANGMTMREAAKAANISRSVFSAKINGKRPFNADEIIRICDALKITEDSKKIQIFLR